MALSNLSTWPFILFGILEPIMLIWAYIVCLKDPYQYYSDQAPVPAPFGTFTSQAESLTLAMGNVLLLLAALAVICCWTSHSTITRNYLIAVALADFGHIYATYRGLGPEAFWDFGNWNSMIWGNVGASAFLNVNRWLTVLGAFGKGRRDVVKKNI